jgi:site-specific recombinase XerD
VSINTINAYRDTFILLLNFIENSKHIKIEKLTIDKITKETIIEFLDWIQKIRNCSDSTRNCRLAAIHSFYKYLQYESLDYLHECQKILSIKFKRSKRETISYLTIEGIKLVLRQPDTTTASGRRDLTLLSLMYDIGARVQEIIDLTPSMLHLDKPSTVKVLGKGKKFRLVPMLDAQTAHLKRYLKERHLDEHQANMHPLFFNSRKEKLTRAGINHIVQKYCTAAREKDKMIIPDKVSCHSFRHSKAMHLLQAGVNLVYIRDILGHISIQTTEIYARADSKQKRIALEKAYTNLNADIAPVWENNENLVGWLKRF